MRSDATRANWRRVILIPKNSKCATLQPTHQPTNQPTYQPINTTPQQTKYQQHKLSTPNNIKNRQTNKQTNKKQNATEEEKVEILVLYCKLKTLKLQANADQTPT